MYLPHFAEAFYEYLRRFDDMPSMLHISGTTTVSWYTFMWDLARIYGFDPNLICPRDHEIEVQSAPRPYRAGLDVSLSNKLGLPQYGYLEGLLEMRQHGR